MADEPDGSDLHELIQRIERLTEEKRALSADIAVVFAEAKSKGYDPKIMRLILRERQMDAADRQEIAALLDAYREALGMFAETPLGQASLHAVQTGPKSRKEGSPIEIDGRGATDLATGPERTSGQKNRADNGAAAAA